MRHWCSPALHSSLASHSTKPAQAMRPCRVRHIVGAAVDAVADNWGYLGHYSCNNPSSKLWANPHR
jgi:hypothetical protein